MESTCPICIEDLNGKIKASPDTCDHIFCLPCLEKWTKLGSFCPVDRKRYRKIINLESDSLIQVKPRKRRRLKTVYDFTTKCEVCVNDTNADVLLLCDCCDLAFHSFCLTPPLKKVPVGLWFCPTCIAVEEKLKKSNGITKEVEADLGNANLEIKQKVEDCDVQRITSSKKQNFVKESINEDEIQNSDKFTNAESITDEQCVNAAETCNNIVSEFQDIIVEKDCNENIFNYNNNSSDSDDKIDKMCKTFDFRTKSCKPEYSKITKTYDLKHKRKQKVILNISDQDEMSKTLNASSEKAIIKDLLLKNNTLKDVSLLDDGLSKAVVYGEMKMDRYEKYTKNMCKTGMENYIKENEALDSKSKHVQSEEYYKSSTENNFGKKIHEISSPNKETFQHHQIKLTSNENNLQVSCENEKEQIQRNAKSVDTSSMHNLPSCSSISLESYKGTFNNLISCACFERPNVEIIENKSVKEQQKGKVQFSVFERIEGNDASQKKYSEINSIAGVSFSSNLNIRHCFSCKATIIAASRNYCKICKLKYLKNPLMKERNSKYTNCSNQSQAFKSLDDFNKGNISHKLSNQRSSDKKCTNVLEKRQYSLLCMLQKIHDSKKK